MKADLAAEIAHENQMLPLLQGRKLRPYPSNKLGEFTDGYRLNIAPAYDLPLWVKKTFLEPSSKLFNNDHYHLYDYMDGQIGFLWAAGGFTKQMRRVIGQTEQVMFRASGFQRMRAEQQIAEWYGTLIPEFLITLDASYCAECSDLEFCALIEHEISHIGHALNEFEQPKFHRDNGLPVLTMRGHDVEEFVGIVRRYGAAKGSAIDELVKAANSKPEIAKVDIAGACGTCLKLVA
jgi:Putative phage metallopeptidase